jgi:hypothetical protein
MKNGEWTKFTKVNSRFFLYTITCFGGVFLSKKYISFNKNIRNVLATSAVATALAFSVGTGQAFADDHETQTSSQIEETVQQDQTQTVETTADINVDSSNQESELTETTVEEGTMENTAEVVTEESTEEETDINSEDDEAIPSLLPDNFFYFVKKLMENVQLALTFDEVKGKHGDGSSASFLPSLWK